MYPQIQVKIIFFSLLLICTILHVVFPSTYYLFRANQLGSPLTDPTLVPDVPDDYDDAHDFLHWHGHIFYKLNTDTIPETVTLPDVEEAISNACETWSEVNNC